MQQIHYADLTWPEVAALPRDLPLLIPLGLGDYDLEGAAARLNAPALGLLPALPYGFSRVDGDPLASLAVRPGLWRRVLAGIAKELRGQGFRRLVLLNGHGDLGPAVRGLPALDLPFQPQPSPPWPADLPQRSAVISTGHTEQHGHHLPLSTDTLIVQAIADGLTTRAPGEVWCLPAWPYGVSTHTREFPGTLNLGGRVFEDFFLAIVDRLAALGAQTIYFSNGHGGNHSFLVNVVKLAGERHPQRFIATEWLHTTGPALTRHRESAIGGMGHGGELETSYLLHLRPDLVRMALATTETDFISTAGYYMDWVEGGRLIANPPWSDDTRSGIYGDGRLGAAEKGRLWLEAAVEEKLETVRELREQHTLRQIRRAWSAHSGVLRKDRPER
ncbi:MAG TPA: creatininase family protein [Anaerolineae bacterium]|nr:creatininase family protein [Anaerolineae bacterium]